MLRKTFSTVLIIVLMLVAIPSIVLAQESMLEQEKGKTLRAEPDLTVTQADLEEIQAFAAFMKTINITFYLDTTYQYVFNKPDGADITDGSRPLYQENNSFSINAFTTSIEKTPTLDGGVVDLFGFRADVLIGEQAGLLFADGLGDEDSEIDLYQAYISLLIPAGEQRIYLSGGKFVTLAGYEVIEARNNPNVTRSWLFGNAIPFTHTGLRLAAPVGPFNLTVGLNNGWDNVDDNNEGKTFEAQAAYTYAGDTITDMWIGATYYGGKEDDDNNSWRNLFTLVGLMEINERWLFAVDLDFANENDVPDLGGDSASWWGIAGYIVADVHPAVNIALRGEVFDDQDGVRIGTPGTGIKVYEVTPTISIKPFKGLIAGVRYLDNMEWRFEFRWDHADQPFFVEDDGSLSKDQYGLMAQLLYWIEI